ncbi:MAG TPA: FecR domain-containing protein [Agriterribacter sp.]|nr:FecR domain-containing protein [Agriterribacter sp.]
MDKSKFIRLVDNYVTGTLSGEEWKQLKYALDDPENLAYLDEELLLTFLNDTYFFEEGEAGKTAITEGIMQKIKKLDESNHLAQHPMVAAMKSFVRNWQRAAAAVLFFILAGVVSWWVFNNNNEKQHIDFVQQTIDVPPGKNGAILKLADGREVVLDSLADGVIASQRGTIVELKNGRLVYDADEKIAGEMLFNTMTTPKGRQFQLLLPDGTKVWLNAASSITYPAFFAGDSRRVKVSGEVYFEVAKMKDMPFYVDIHDKAEVKVLGTHFNISSYEEEGSIKTTLLEGSIQTSVWGAGKAPEYVVLKPGQQAEITNDSKIELNEPVNTDQVMAWKNELFNFENASLEEVMRQLSRWYDIEVLYEQGIPQMVFGGEMSRNVSLAGLLSGLERAGVHFRIEEGNRLIVLP